MKSITLANGQIIEPMPLKEMLFYISEIVESGYTCDGSLYVEYKDGCFYYVDEYIVEGKFRKTGIKTIIENNGASYCVYGKYRLEKTNEEDSDEDCIWNVEPA